MVYLIIETIWFELELVYFFTVTSISYKTVIWLTFSTFLSGNLKLFTIFNYDIVSIFKLNTLIRIQIVSTFTNLAFHLSIYYLVFSTVRHISYVLNTIFSLFKTNIIFNALFTMNIILIVINFTFVYILSFTITAGNRIIFGFTLYTKPLIFFCTIDTADNFTFLIWI